MVGSLVRTGRWPRCRRCMLSRHVFPRLALFFNVTSDVTVDDFGTAGRELIVFVTGDFLSSGFALVDLVEAVRLTSIRDATAGFGANVDSSRLGRDSDKNERRFVRVGEWSIFFNS